MTPKMKIKCPVCGEEVEATEHWTCPNCEVELNGR